MSRYDALRDRLLRLLKAPTAPPDAPVGSHGSVEIFRASPRFLRYRLLVIAIEAAFVLFVIMGLLIAAAITGKGPLLAVVVVLIAVAVPLLTLHWFLIRVDYDLRYYIVTDRSLRVREGAWTVREMTLTHANVQNLKVSRGPLMRMYGIWDLTVEAAGGGSAAGKHELAGGGHQVHFRGLEDASIVRDKIAAHLRSQRGGAAAAGAAAPGGARRLGPGGRGQAPAPPGDRLPRRGREPAARAGVGARRPVGLTPRLRSRRRSTMCCHRECRM